MAEIYADLRHALAARGITSQEDFCWRYGIDPRSFTADDAMALVRQRDAYVQGYTQALAALRQRLERGLVVLAADPSLETEARWFRLATRSCRLIAKLSAADRQAGENFLASELGRWFGRLAWPVPSPVFLDLDARAGTE